MRILFVDQFGSIGGGQTVLIEMLRAIIGRFEVVSVMAPGGGSVEETVAREFGNRVQFYSCEKLNLTHGRKVASDILALLRYGWRFRRHLPVLRSYDLIYVNGLRHLPHILLLSLFTQSKVIYHVHLDHSAVEKVLLQIAARWPTTFRIVVNSRFISERLGIAGARIIMLENALSRAFATLPFVDRFTDRGPGWVSVAVGTLRPEKGQDIAVDVMSESDNMVLHLIGRDGEGVGKWISDLKKRSSTQVYFDGPTDDLPATLDAIGAQFNLVPSRWDEPFGLVAIEGMACSCLTLLSGRGGLAEIAEKTGAPVARDSAEMAATLRRLCALPKETLAKIARKQFDAVRNTYAPEHFYTEFQHLLEEASQSCSLASKSRPAPPLQL